MTRQQVRARESGMRPSKPPEDCIIVIFGASGDLTRRELIPALYNLQQLELLPESYAIVGFARRDWKDADFRSEMNKRLREEYPESPSIKDWKAFERRLFFEGGDFEDADGDSYARLIRKIEQVRKRFKIPANTLFHLATPPSFYGTIVKQLSGSGLLSGSGWQRVIIEKPFGRDERSARKLDREIQQVLKEDQIYRVDHFLGKETVQNMLVFRFANPGFEPIWNRNYIDNIQITVAEDLGIGTRGSFFEGTGIVRDMVQNHVLQLLCMTAIEPPVFYDAESLRAETVKVLDSICPVQVESDVVLGQYRAGKVDGKKVPAYRKEEDVDPESATPTFAALRVYVDNWRWAGVPFYLRTGKRLERKITEVTINFKPTPHLMFPVRDKKRLERSVLTFRLQPEEGILYQLMAKQPGAEIVLHPVDLDFTYRSAFGVDRLPNAYQWLLLDAMQGDQTLFPRSDWIHRAWGLVDPILKKWESKPWLDVPNYAAGSWGPKESETLIKTDGHEWSTG